MLVSDVVVNNEVRRGCEAGDPTASALITKSTSGAIRFYLLEEAGLSCDTGSYNVLVIRYKHTY